MLGHGVDVLRLSAAYPVAVRRSRHHDLVPPHKELRASRRALHLRRRPFQACSNVVQDGGNGSEKRVAIRHGKASSGEKVERDDVEMIEKNLEVRGRGRV